MEYRKLGPSGAIVTSFALGTMTFGAESDEATSFQLMDDYLAGAAAAQGRLLTAVHENEQGTTVMSAMSAETVLLVLMQPTADVGALLFDLRRHRANIAALV